MNLSYSSDFIAFLRVVPTMFTSKSKSSTKVKIVLVVQKFVGKYCLFSIIYMAIAFRWVVGTFWFWASFTRRSIELTFIKDRPGICQGQDMHTKSLLYFSASFIAVLFLNPTIICFGSRSKVPSTHQLVEEKNIRITIDSICKLRIIINGAKNVLYKAPV